MSASLVTETCRRIWLSVPERHRGDLVVPKIEAGVTSALAAGWRPEQLLEYVCTGIDTDKLPAASVHKRLRDRPQEAVVPTKSTTPTPPAFDRDAWDLEQEEAVPPTESYLEAKERLLGRRAM